MATPKKPMAAKAVVVTRTLSPGQKIRIPVKIKKRTPGAPGWVKVDGPIENRWAVRNRVNALRTVQTKLGTDGGTWLKADWLKLTPNSKQDRVYPIAREVKKVLAALKKQLG